MSKTEIPEDIAALARKIGKQFKSEQDLADFGQLLKKIAVEAALGAEIVPARIIWTPVCDSGCLLQGVSLTGFAG